MRHDAVIMASNSHRGFASRAVWQLMTLRSPADETNAGRRASAI